jgi:hypothetical protein
LYGLDSKCEALVMSKKDPAVTSKILRQMAGELGLDFIVMSADRRVLS